MTHDSVPLLTGPDKSKQNLADYQRRQKAEGRAQNKASRRCFWTLPLGHVYHPDVSESGWGWYTCANCGVTVWRD